MLRLPNLINKLYPSHIIGLIRAGTNGIHTAFVVSDLYCNDTHENQQPYFSTDAVALVTNPFVIIPSLLTLSLL